MAPCEVGLGKALMFASVYPILRIFRTLPWDWWVFLGLFIVSFVLLVVFGRKGSSSPQVSGPQLAAVAPATPSPEHSPFDVDKFFRDAYIGQMQTDAEAKVRAIIQSRAPAERAEFTIRFVATLIVNVVHENTWIKIYRSQLLALMALNRAYLRREQIKAFYDEAARKFPQVYAKYTFEQWLGFLRGEMLLLEHPGQTFEITVRGKDFLKYTVHCGYVAENRAY